MKTKYLTMVGALLALSMTACNQRKDEIGMPFPTGELTFEASFGDGKNTKTAVVNDTEVWWTPDDAISVFYGDLTSGKFTSTIAEKASTSKFVGSLSAVIGTLESGSQDRRFWAVYPYDIQNACDGSSVTLNVSSKQVGAEGTFRQNLFPSIATSAGLDLAFYNVCGGMVVTVDRDNIRSITLSGNNEEILAGKVRVAFVDEDPAVLELVNGERSITFRSPDNKPFVPGVRYFITVLPVEFSQGYSLTFTTGAGEVGTKTVSDTKKINRSRFLVAFNADANVNFTTSPVNPNLMRFADDDVKEALIAAFDTDSDGELSYDEAAAVTSSDDLKAAFGEGKSYTSFEEFQYFTGITSLASSMFLDWGHLKTIVLPNTITEIKNAAFKNCTSLQSIVVPESVKSLGKSAFEGCESLLSIVIPEGVTTIPIETFKNCSSLASFVIPGTVTAIESDAFYYCRGLKTLRIPESVTTLGYDAFYGCESLSNLYIDDFNKILALLDPPYSNNSPLMSTEQQVHLFVAGEEVTSITFSEGLTKIPANALRNCAFITTAHIPESVTSIGNYAFYGCERLKSFTIPGGVTSLGDYSFSRCNSITKMVLPEGIIYVGYEAFSSIDALTSFEFPSSTKSIGGRVLELCRNLTSITIKATSIPSGGYYMFNRSNCPIYVPEESLDAYRTANYWSEYKDRYMPILLEGDDPSVSSKVVAQYFGGSVSVVNGLIQYNSKLQFGVLNYSNKAIKVLTMQLVDGETGEASNLMSVDETIDPGTYAVWTITIGSNGIHSPEAIFVYSCEGKRYETRASYTEEN